MNESLLRSQVVRTAELMELWKSHASSHHWTHVWQDMIRVKPLNIHVLDHLDDLRQWLVAKQRDFQKIKGIVIIARRYTTTKI